MSVGRLNNRCRDECLLQSVERLKVLFLEDERGIFDQKMSEGSSNMGNVLNEYVPRNYEFSSHWWVAAVVQ
jgi:hypothetical protein